MIIDAGYCLDYHKLLGLDPLLRLLRNVAGMTHVYPLGDGTSFDAVATALASSLSSSSDKDTNFLMDEGPDQSPLLLPPEKRARIWLCEFIDREVRHWATYLRKALERSIEETDTDTETQQEVEEEVEEKLGKRKKLDSLVDVYWQLVNKFPSLPWSRTADQGDAALHEGREAPGNPNTVIGRLINMVDYYEWTEDTGFEISELVAAQLKRIQPISPEAQQYENAFHYALCWQSLFSTSAGLIGMGPNWLRRGDSVMLIQGAIVPYIFRHVDDNLKLQVEGLKKEMEELEKELLAQKHSNDEKEQKEAMDTRRKIAKLRRKFIQTDGQIGRKDGWTLIGEAYVEGVMRGEILERQGNDIWERIAIV